MSNDRGPSYQRRRGTMRYKNGTNGFRRTTEIIAVLIYQSLKRDVDIEWRRHGKAAAATLIDWLFADRSGRSTPGGPFSGSPRPMVRGAEVHPPRRRGRPFGSPTYPLRVAEAKAPPRRGRSSTSPRPILRVAEVPGARWPGQARPIPQGGSLPRPPPLAPATEKIRRGWTANAGQPLRAEWQTLKLTRK